ncbi:Der1-like family-domain-containing protein [Pelagophyceae sp. CCMP2097]|nr:Der1-like family-domain-containing protein [Pelagophyceae sp. CCMP2097]|mmetsp:Transcript_31286/g.105284  ORF Transcript_31286/g.105284 Transcript_31286/m.105284 type:complete len:263 (+) Transcript_31286:98-886(+)
MRLFGAVLAACVAASSALPARRSPLRPVSRGGAIRDEEEPEKEPSAISKMLAQLPPCTRSHLVGVAGITLVGVSGLVDPDAAFSLDNFKSIFQLQVWRPLSAALFLGTPSMGMATNCYLLWKYGIELEQAVGSPKYAKFLALQVTLLTMAASAAGMPMTASSLVAAIIYACSRRAPFDDIRFQFGIKLKYWMLPFGLVVVDCLQQQSMAAAFAPLLGILCSHFHHFFAVVWPRLQAQNAPAASPLRPALRQAKKGTSRKLGD